MSLPIPLNVDLGTGRGAFRATRDLHDLTFRVTAPGGFASARMSLERPLDVQPADIAYYGLVTISDGRNGAVVWQGRLEDPSRGADSGGRIWELSAVGPAAHAEDAKVPLVYAYRDLRHWERTEATLEPFRTVIDEENWLLEMPQGLDIADNDQARIMTLHVREAGMSIGRVNWNMVGGGSSANYLMEGQVRGGAGTQTIRSEAQSTTPTGLSARVVGTDWTHPVDRFDVRFRRSGATTVGVGRWMKMFDFRIRSTLFDRHGSEMTSGGSYTADHVLAHEIVEDLLGRLLDQYDGPTATIATTTTEIEQLFYPDGVTPRQVLDDLATFEPDHYWAAWELTSNGLHRFEYVPWPTGITYETDVSDGYKSTASADDLFNEVRVRWRMPNGRITTATRTQQVPELTAAGLTRIGFIDAGDNLIGTPGGASTLGDRFLAEHRVPRNAGSLTVSRPVVDHDTGRVVQPWEILPGRLIRVRGVQPRVDALNPGGRDGVSVFRIVGVEYNAASASATLELDSKPLTVSGILGQLAQQVKAGVRDRRRR